MRVDGERKTPNHVTLSINVNETLTIDEIPDTYLLAIPAI
jgi:hypothetical protein